MKHPPGGAHITPRLFVMVGLPGAGKTTVARQLEGTVQALRLTPDEWMLPLFGAPEADGKRDVLEGRFVWLAMSALRAGVNVILDFGCWSKNERSALRSLATAAGAACDIVYLAVDEAEQRQRLTERSPTVNATTFEINDRDLVASREMFEVPDASELASREVDPPPDGYASWTAWISERWPTSTD